MKKTRSVLLFSVVKAAITVSLIVVICTKIDFSGLAQRLDAGGTVYFVLGTLLLALTVFFVAARWWLLLRRLDVETISPGYAVAATYISVFVGQVLPGAVGADVVRGWLCYNRGVALRPTVMSLVTDRMLAILGVAVVAGLAWLWHFETFDYRLGRQIAVLGALVVAVVAAALWLLPAMTNSLARRWGRLRPVHELVTIFRFTALSRAGIAGLALSCVTMAMTVNAAILYARGFGIVLLPVAAYVAVPVAILSSALPISIAGWGVREASLSYCLILFGMAPEDAALIGLSLGIGIVLASLPGGIVMLLFGVKVRPALRRGAS
jgi:glycosyltransferase 2 family protein